MIGNEQAVVEAAKLLREIVGQEFEVSAKAVNQWGARRLQGPCLTPTVTLFNLPVVLGGRPRDG